MIDVTRFPLVQRFLRFLRENPHCREQTLAVYSFHEPLAEIAHTNPAPLKKFNQLITKEIFRTDEVKMYGEDMTYVWPQGKECLTGVIDYEVHTF